MSSRVREYQAARAKSRLLERGEVSAPYEGSDQNALSTLIKDETQTKALEVFLVVKIVRFILSFLKL